MIRLIFPRSKTRHVSSVETMTLQVKFAFLCAVCMMCVVKLCEARSKRFRPVIHKSLLVVDEQGIEVIKDASELTKNAISKSYKPIFMDDHHFIKRVALVESSLSKTSKGGGLWNVDECAFKSTQNKKENKQLAALHKTIRRTFGVTWSKIKYRDLRRPLYSVLAARIILEMAVPSIPRGLRNQARLWLEKYHECAEKPSHPQVWEDMKNKFIRGACVFVSSYYFILHVFSGRTSYMSDLALYKELSLTEECSV